MNHIDDELLNKYIDNELGSQELSLINEHIKICIECLARLKALKVVDTHLKRLDVTQLGTGFTENIMNKINKAAVILKPKKYYFFRFIFSLFILVMLGVFSLLITSTSNSMNESTSFMDYLDLGTSYLSSNFKNLVGKINVSLVGTVISLIFFISMYLIYDSHRKLKNRLNRL